MPKYQLRRRFWDGLKTHPPLTILEFEEGRQPRTAVPVEEAVEAAVKAASSPETLSELQAKEPALADPAEVKKGTALSELEKKK